MGLAPESRTTFSIGGRKEKANAAIKIEKFKNTALQDGPGYTGWTGFLKKIK